MTITDGGLLVGLAIIAIRLGTWWWTGRAAKTGPPGKGGAAGTGGRNWRGLLPFATCMCLGIVLRLGVGGLLGGAAGMLSRGENQLGDDGLRTLAGAHATSVTHAQIEHLQVGSALVVILLVTLFVIRWRLAHNQPAMRRDMGFGLLSGMGLAAATAVTSFYASSLMPALVSIGGTVSGWK